MQLRRTRVDVIYTHIYEKKVKKKKEKKKKKESSVKKHLTVVKLQRVPAYLSLEIITSFPRKNEQLVICRCSPLSISSRVTLILQPSTLHDTVIIMLERSNVRNTGH